MKIIVTGGAGFIGSHIVDALLKARHQVTVYDNLDPQVHGPKARKPDYLSKKAKFVRGDVRDLKAFKKVLKGQDVLFHKAAAVGVAQSMYEIARYTDINAMGAATVLQAVADGDHNLKRMIVASSMSIYGEGLYKCKVHGDVTPKLRSNEQLAKQQWEMTCPRCRRAVKQRPTPESKPVIPTSIYAINKRDHEEMFLVAGRAYDVPTVALRYFNVYGPRQALSNPYTGAAAIFSGAMLSDKKPVVFEDGEQSRDFIHVSDIVQANMIALRRRETDYGVYNVGTGRNLSINRLIKTIAKELGFKKGINVTGEFRAGDIRHCYADIRGLKKLGYVPQVRFEDGVHELCNWVRTQRADNRSGEARKELIARGLAT